MKAPDREIRLRKGKTTKGKKGGQKKKKKKVRPAKKNLW